VEVSFVLLGMIADVSENSFKAARDKGLSFVEFCLNVGYDLDSFFQLVPQIKEWQKQYGVKVQSIGRWATDKFTANGEVILEELENNQRLIQAASELNCPNYVCGVNYLENMSLYANATLAIEYLSKLLNTADDYGVRLAMYNCRWNNWIVEPRSWELILGHLPKLGIKYDPSHCVYDGGDYLQEIRDWGKRIYHFHVKGALAIKGERYDDPPAGMDQINWGAVLSILYAQGYNGGLSIEPHSVTWVGELGEKGLDFTIEYIKRFIF